METREYFEKVIGDLKNMCKTYTLKTDKVNNYKYFPNYGFVLK